MGDYLMLKQHYSLGFFPLFDNDYSIRYWNWWKHWLTPSNYWRTVKYFCQRGYRGYADCDSWDADSYMEAMMLGLLTNLQNTKHGYPSGLCTCDPGDTDDDFCDNSVDCDGQEQWNKILDEIVEGLKAARELRTEDTIPEELVYPRLNEPLVWERCKDSDELFTMADDKPGQPQFVVAEYDKWAAPLIKKKRRAAHLLVKHWGSFWD
jgi:hypothetical protein